MHFDRRVGKATRALECVVMHAVGTQRFAYPTKLNQLRGLA
jgi:hypothetical protein